MGWSGSEPVDTAVVGPPPIRPGTLWRRALARLTRALAAEGLSQERALEIAEAAIIACALRHEPRNAEEAYRYARLAARETSAL
jgi:hypothetical protein